MPVFEYRCQDCGKDFEKLVRKDGQEVVCPDCGSENVEKKLSVFGFSCQCDVSTGTCPCCQDGRK